MVAPGVVPGTGTNDTWADGDELTAREATGLSHRGQRVVCLMASSNATSSPQLGQVSIVLIVGYSSGSVCQLIFMVGICKVMNYA